MKTVRHLAAHLLLFLVAFLRAEADTTTSDSSSDAADTSSANDPDAVPRAFVTKQGPDPSEVAARNAEAAKEDQNRTWLQRAYEQQLRSRDAADNPGATREDDFFTQLSLDKDLAKAAGLPPPDPTEAPEKYLRTESTDDHASADLRPPPPSPARAGSALYFKPLITPLGASDAVGLHPFLANQSVLAPIPGMDPLPSSSTPSHTDDSDDMDVPGMTAAENNPAEKEELTLDMLPGETPAQERAHHDLALSLPVASNADRLQKLQTDALNVPGQKPKTPDPVRPPVPPPSDTANMVPDPAPERGRVSNAFDILH